MNGRRTAADIIRLGRWLLPVKERLPAGKVHNWLVEEFGESRETARKYIDGAQSTPRRSRRLKRGGDDENITTNNP